MKKSLRNMNALAREFSKLLRETLSEDEMKKVVERNRLPQNQTDEQCASHDFCDPNEVMGEAFLKVVGRESRASSQSDADLWNAAWSLAKSHDFVVDAIPKSPHSANFSPRPARLKDLVSEWIASGLVSESSMVRAARESMNMERDTAKLELDAMREAAGVLDSLVNGQATTTSDEMANALKMLNFVIASRI